MLHWIKLADCDGIHLVGISRWFTEKSNKIFSSVSHATLERLRTWIHAALNFSGLLDHGYRPPFISCIVRNITCRFFSFIFLKKSLYLASNFHSTTSVAEYISGDIVKWYILSVHNFSTILSMELSTSLSSRGSKMNDTTGILTPNDFSMFSISSGVLSADFNQK